MNPNNSLLKDLSETPEEMLGPPRIDGMGVVMMMAVSVVSGIFVSLGILITSFFAIRESTLGSGISPFILAMSTFFVLCFAMLIYLFSAKRIFPAIYTKTAELHKHLFVFLIILYFCLLPLYLYIGSPTFANNSLVLIPYISHILLAVFGMELLLGLISSYRYVVLSFYANIISLILSGSLVAFFLNSLSQSVTSAFVLMGLSIFTFFVSTTIVFLVKFLYYKFYTLTGNDPLGTTFYNIETSEQKKIESAQNTLLQ